MDVLCPEKPVPALGVSELAMAQGVSRDRRFWFERDWYSALSTGQPLVAGHEVRARGEGCGTPAMGAERRPPKAVQRGPYVPRGRVGLARLFLPGRKHTWGSLSTDPRGLMRGPLGHSWRPGGFLLPALCPHSGLTHHNLWANAACTASQTVPGGCTAPGV